MAGGGGGGGGGGDKEEEASGASFSSLPEDCISCILSLTSPRDLCRVSAVSSDVRSIAESDVVWEHFLPSDYKEILSRSVDPVKFVSLRELYFRLCDSILVDGGAMSFALERLTGKKCLMLSAREAAFVWKDDPDYWKWTPLPDSRFSEAVELVEVWWLDIHGRIDLRELTPKTTYIAYLVFRLRPGAYGLSNPFQDASISVGACVSAHSVCLQPYEQDQAHQNKLECLPRIPQARRDGWMEVEIGEFFTDERDDGAVNMMLRQTRTMNRKTGLIMQGIEVRPKDLGMKRHVL